MLHGHWQIRSNWKNFGWMYAGGGAAFRGLRRRIFIEECVILFNSTIFFRRSRNSNVKTKLCAIFYSDCRTRRRKGDEKTRWFMWKRTKARVTTTNNPRRRASINGRCTKQRTNWSSRYAYWRRTRKTRERFYSSSWNSPSPNGTKSWRGSKRRTTPRPSTKQSKKAWMDWCSNNTQQQNAQSRQETRTATPKKTTKTKRL